MIYFIVQFGVYFF